MYRIPIALALFAPGALTAVAAQPHPADAAAGAPAVRYDSAFAGYRPFHEEKPGDWRALNEDVGRAGGHVGIMRGTSGQTSRMQPAPAPAAPAHKH